MVGRLWIPNWIIGRYANGFPHGQVIEYHSQLSTDCLYMVYYFLNFYSESSLLNKWVKYLFNSWKLSKESHSLNTLQFWVKSIFQSSGHCSDLCMFPRFRKYIGQCNMVIIKVAGLMMSSKRHPYMGNRVNGGVLRSSLIHRSNYTGDDFRK